MSLRQFQLPIAFDKNPGRLYQVDWRDPLTQGLVFCAYPVGSGFYDVISKQFVAAPATSTPTIITSIDGNGSASNYLKNSAVLTFANQTGLDLVNGACTLFAEAKEGAAGQGGKIIASYNSGNGFGIDMRYDDNNGATAFDSFNIYTGNGTNAQYYTGGAPNRALVGGVVTNNNSYAFVRRIAITLDSAGGIKWYAQRKLKQTSAWGANRLPATSTGRRTSLCNNANHSVGITLGYNRVLSLDEYCALYDNPWRVLKAPSKFFRMVVPGAGLLGVSGTSGLGTAAPANSVPITGNSASGVAGSVTGSVPGIAQASGFAASTSIGSVGANVTISLAGNAATSASGTVQPSTLVTTPLNGNVGYSNGNIIVSFGDSVTYYEPDDGVGSAAVNGPAAHFNASISGTVLTVNSVTDGSVQSGLYIVTPGVADGTLITSGSGSAWNLNISQTVSSQDMVGGTYGFNCFRYNDHSTYSRLYQQGVNLTTGIINGLGGYAQPDYMAIPTQVVGSLSGTTLTVTSKSAGTVHVNQQIAVAGATQAGPVTITAFVSGTNGSIGIYTVTNPSSVSIPAGTAMALSYHGGLSYDGQYWTRTGKNNSPADSPMFSDAQLFNGTSQLIVIDMGGAAFDFNGIDLSPISRYWDPAGPFHNYVKFTAYTGTPVSVANNTLTTTGSTAVASGYVDNTTAAMQSFRIPEDVTWLSGSSMKNVTSIAMEGYNYTMGRLTSGVPSNSPYYSFDYIQVAPVRGAVVPSTSVAAIGNSSSAAIGTASVPGGAALTGNFATGAVGTIVPIVAPAIAGNAGTGSYGTVISSTIVPFVGNLAVINAGAVLPAVAVVASGNSSATAIGTASVPPDGTAITGNSATSAVGTVIPSSSLAIVGNSAAANIGTIVPGAAMAITGNAVSSAVGSAVVYSYIALAQNGAYGVAGTVGSLGGIPWVTYVPPVPNQTNIRMGLPRVRLLGSGGGRVDYTPKRVSEREVYGVDFQSLLPEGITIQTATAHVIVASGSDPDPQSMVVGAATIDGTVVVNLFGGGIANTKYWPTFRAVMSDGQVLILPDKGRGLLHVVPD